MATQLDQVRAERIGARQQEKADALRVAVKDHLVDNGAELTGPTLRQVADALWLGRRHAELWAGFARMADVNVPGSSTGNPDEVVGLVCDGLRADADDLDSEDADLLAALAASLAAVRASRR